ncbi:MAG: hypothetical protein ABIQ31_18455 [Ferruginibacter sp.]
MNTKIAAFFSKKLLVITNVLTATLLGFFLIKENYSKPVSNDSNTAIIKKATTADKVISEKELSAMNNNFHPVYEDFSTGNSTASFRVLVLGNSLSIHPALESIGWSHKSGMAASKISEDYVHILLAKVSAKLPGKKIIFRVANFADFERHPNSLSQTTIDSLILYKPDMAIFQLGENVNEEGLPLFQSKYIDLIKSLQSGRPLPVICTTPFFPSLIKNKMVDSVTAKTNSFLVDISHLPLLDSTNYAKNEAGYKGNREKWTVTGIGMHPGDKGMRNIAEQIFIAINGIISRQGNW